MASTAIDFGSECSIANRVFKTEEGIRPGELLAGDIAYLKFKNKHYYLSVVMDLFSREIDILEGEISQNPCG